MMNTPPISVVIPVYNSQGTLPELIRRLEKTLGALTERFEIILINDGSADASWEVIRRLAAETATVRGLNLMRNYGQHNALLAGVREARHDLIVTLDDDLQNPPEEIPRLLARLQTGVDVVYGTPASEQHGFFRDLASRCTKVAMKMSMGVAVAPKVSAFRAFRTTLRQAFAGYHGPAFSLDVLLTWGTSRFSWVTVEHQSRQLGRSNYSTGKLLLHALNMITGYSTLPLRITSWIGFCLTLFGIGIFLYVIIRYLLQGSPVQGFPFLAAIIAIFSGAQLFSMGIIGEYLARIHFRSMEKPSYAILERTDG